MSSVFSGKSLRVSVWLGVVLAVLAFAAVSWSDTERNVDAEQRTVIAMKASGAANPCAAENPCNPTDMRMAQNACNPCAAANPCNPCNPCGAANPCNPCAAANPCNPCNPCAAANPCNPCAAANPCNPCNPCAAANPCNPCNPCAAANPCNPCNPCGGGAKIDAKQVLRPSGTGLHAGLSQLQLLEMGEALWNDRGLSTNGLACGVCHRDGGNFADTFAEPYPHRVQMPHRMSGVDKVALDEMIQFCMLAPMAAEALPWDSPELAALTLYGTVEVQRNFIKMAANPCNPEAAANPCNPCNPCAAANPCNPCNPCAAANPCNPCNPCAAANPCNPCAAANPCNPCAAVAAANPCNPCAAANPCNPCAASNPCNPCNPCAGGN